MKSSSQTPRAIRLTCSFPKKLRALPWWIRFPRRSCRRARLVWAQIDPRGEHSEYEFQYGTSDCASSPSSCVTVPIPAGEIAAGFGDQGVSVTLEGLQPATAYHYRVAGEQRERQRGRRAGGEHVHDASVGGRAAGWARVGNGLAAR